MDREDIVMIGSRGGMGDEKEEDEGVAEWGRNGLGVRVLGQRGRITPRIAV